MKYTKIIKLTLTLFLSFLSIQVFCQDVIINEFLASNTSSNLDPNYNKYSDWIELYNKSNSDIDLSGYFLTDNFDRPTKWVIPNDVIAKANDYLVIWADGNDSANHANFKLSKNGEVIGLYNTDTLTIDSLIFGAQQDDISYGRIIESPENWAFFSPPSQKEENNSANIANITAEPIFITEGGIFNSTQSLAFNNSENSNIYFTTDGSKPDETSNLYSNPINIDTTTVIRARAFQTGKPPSEVLTHTFLINENITLPIISISSNPDNFFSNINGIYVKGTNGTGGYCDDVISNLKQDWERPVNIEFYDDNGKLQINQKAGIKIFGGCSRHRFPQKSLALFARSSYGKGSFDYKLFPDKSISKFESFVLRSAADDQVRTMFRDALSQIVLVETMDADYQAYRPAIVFLNGVYWGIHNIREKINENYIVSNFDIAKSNINLLQGNGWEAYGNNAGYNNMVNFAANNNMADPTKYKIVKDQMDINQYIDYQIGHIYLAERDWPGNNIKFWRANSGQYDKWRWINFDMDQSFLYQWAWEDMITKTTVGIGQWGWPNPNWSVRLFKNLLDNNEFKNEFIQRYAWHINTTFAPDRLVGIIDSMSSAIAPEIPRHIERWGGKIDPNFSESWPILPTISSVEFWKAEVDTMKIFANLRPNNTRENFINKFALSGYSSISINSNIRNAGELKILNYSIQDSNYSGIYFNDVPLTLKAKAFVGYRFSHWNIDNSEYYTNDVEVILSNDTEIVAYFEIDSIKTEDMVIINEINYNSSTIFDTKDWVEIFNTQDNKVELGGWFLQDDNEQNNFVFAKETFLEIGDYLVICDDTNSFKTHHPEVKNIIGNFDFNLNNNGEVIKLYSNNNIFIDSVRFRNQSPWPEEPDGMGYTLELISTENDNSLAENWKTSIILNGTPGSVNSVLTELNKNEEIEITNKFELYSNYPNPFNPQTNISYSIDKARFIKLRIFNSLGEQVRVLINEKISAGNHIVSWNGKDDNGNFVSSGIYFYSLESFGAPVQARKMLLLK